MANLDHLFRKFDNELNVLKSKKESLMTSRDNLRKKIRDYFSENHSNYKPTFYIQGSYKLKTMIRTKDDTCDLDDGVYFKENTDNVSGTTLQRWVKDAVTGITDATPNHRKKCITIDYKAGYNIDLPVLIFNEASDPHPYLAVKDSDFQLDDPKEFVTKFNEIKEIKTDQIVRMVKYLKSWCNHKTQSMPSGLSMTVLTMKHFQANLRDDIALKFLLIEIENVLNKSFECTMPTTPNDDLFNNFSEQKKFSFMDNLSNFIEDAKKAVDENNKYKASILWKKHLGDRFPEGEDEDEKKLSSAILSPIIGASKPYYNN